MSSCKLITGFVAIIAVCSVIVTGQVQFEGKCNNVTTQLNFNVTKYLGLWYEIEKYPNFFQDTEAHCITAEYSQLANGSVGVQNSMRLRGHNVTILGHAEQLHPNMQDGKLIVSFPSVQSYNGTYWVLGTDYTNYSVVWSCRDRENNTNLQFAWILSRTPNITNADKTIVDQLIMKNHLDRKSFIHTNQTKCWAHHHKRNGANVGLSISLTLFVVLNFVIYLF